MGPSTKQHTWPVSMWGSTLDFDVFRRQIQRLKSIPMHTDK